MRKEEDGKASFKGLAAITNYFGKKIKAEEMKVRRSQDAADQAAQKAGGSTKNQEGSTNKQGVDSNDDEDKLQLDISDDSA